MQAPITLSAIPPSLNNAYFNLPKGGRAPTTKLKNWKLAAAWEIAAQRPGHIAGEVHIDVAIMRPNSRSDLDNRSSRSGMSFVRLASSRTIAECEPCKPNGKKRQALRLSASPSRHIKRRRPKCSSPHSSIIDRRRVLSASRLKPANCGGGLRLGLCA
jgi:hypothetical protein